MKLQTSPSFLYSQLCFMIFVFTEVNSGIKHLFFDATIFEDCLCFLKHIQIAVARFGFCKISGLHSGGGVFLAILIILYQCFQRGDAVGDAGGEVGCSADKDFGCFIFNHFADCLLVGVEREVEVVLADFVDGHEK